MIPKNRIRFSRALRYQINPYPEAKLWLKRGVMVLAFLFVLGIYFFAKPVAHRLSNSGREELFTKPKQILGEQEPAIVPEYTAYQVKKGDTLFNLSQRSGISWQTLAEINGLKEPYILKIGQKIKVPVNSDK